MRKTTDSTFPPNIRATFEFAYLNEAYFIKNKESASHLAYKWLKVGFYILVIGTCYESLHVSVAIEGFTRWWSSIVY
jgi:hypothetical protein